MKSRKIVNFSDKLTNPAKYRIACRTIYQLTGKIKTQSGEIYDLLLELLSQIEPVDSNILLIQTVEKISAKCNQLNDICFDAVTRTGLLHGFTESAVNEIMAETIAELKDEGHSQFDDEVYQQVRLRTEDKIQKEIEGNVISLKRR